MSQICLYRQDPRENFIAGVQLCTAENRPYGGGGPDVSCFAFAFISDAEGFCASLPQRGYPDGTHCTDWVTCPVAQQQQFTVLPYEFCFFCGPAPSCCGCDWCCDVIPEGGCVSLRNYPWENLPISNVGPCVGNSCPTVAPAPVCRREEFALGKRPAAHEPPERGGTGHVGRHELHGLGPTRAIDRAPGVEECRTYYGHVGRGAPALPTSRTVGWLCGQYNRNQSSTKMANRCYPSKRPDGRHSFNCAYRVPCPEKPVPCL